MLVNKSLRVPVPEGVRPPKFRAPHRPAPERWCRRDL